jgi:hypothetical protein
MNLNIKKTLSEINKMDSLYPQKRSIIENNTIKELYFYKIQDITE